MSATEIENSELKTRVDSEVLAWIPTRRAAIRIAVRYAVIAAVWIFCSGWVLRQLASTEGVLAELETIKGWLFVLVTAGLLALALDRYFRLIRHAAEKLQASEQRLRAIGDNLPGSYVYHYAKEPDQHPRFLYLSAGFSAVHALGVAQTLQDPTLLIEQLDVPDRIRIMDAERESARTLSDFSLELPFRRGDGSIRLVHIRARPRVSEAAMHWDGIATDVTELRRGEEKLRESEQRFRALVEMAPEAIFVRTGDRFTYLNAAAVKFFGATSVEELLNQSVLERFHPEARAHASELMRQLNDSRPPLSEADRVLLKLDGSRVHASVSAVPITYNNEKSALIFARDVTDRYRVEEVLRQQLQLQNQLARVAATVPGVIYSFRLRPDGSMCMPYTSRELSEVFGVSSVKLSEDATSLFALLHPDDSMRVQQSIQTSATTLKSWNDEFRIQHPDRGEVWIEGHSVPQREPDGTTLWHGFLQDVSDRKQLEAQFRQAQKMEAIGQLAGGIAHDFNNILAAMLMQLDLLTLSHSLSREVLEGVEQLRSSAERAANLTRQLLLFSRRQIMQPSNIDVNEVVLGVGKMLQRIIGDDVRLQLQLHPSVLMTRADAGMLDQVLLNLAVNARDAMDHGGQLTIETFERTFNSEEADAKPDLQPGRYVGFSVRDTGCGIPPEVMPRIFEPFFTTKEVGKGTGLGLATVFGIVKQHRGWIDLTSEPGQGTSFRVYIPGLPLHVQPPGGMGRREKPRGGSETILLAEDDPAVRFLTRITLERQGYRVLESGNAMEALDQWRREKEAVALLLTDIVMPNGVNGHQLARELQAEKATLKVLYTSGYSAELAGREIGLRSGENFIQKPCTPDQLLSIVRKSLDA